MDTFDACRTRSTSKMIATRHRKRNAVMEQDGEFLADSFVFANCRMLGKTVVERVKLL